MFRRGVVLFGHLQVLDDQAHAPFVAESVQTAQKGSVVEAALSR